jgi:hypothetical protein
VVGARCECFDRTERAWASRVVHGAPALAIFLVVYIEPDAIRFAELW